MQFGSIEEVKAYIEKAVSNAMENEVYTATKITIQERIQSEVYKAYLPERYIRREYSGGLIADQNLPKSINGTELTVKSTAPPKSGEGYTTDKNLPQVIEEGIASGYDFYGKARDKSFAEARPFMGMAKVDIKDGRAVKALKAGLTRQGITIK